MFSILVKAWGKSIEFWCSFYNKYCKTTQARPKNIQFCREQEKKRAHRHRRRALIFIRVHIWLCCVLFTDSTLNFHCCSGTYQCNAAHFLISADNRGQTFKASAPRKPPIMWQRSLSGCEKSRLSWEPIAAGGKEGESLKWYRNVHFSFSKSRRNRAGYEKKKKEKKRNFPFASMSSGFEFKQSYWIRECCWNIFWFSARHLNESKSFTSLKKKKLPV